MPETPASGAVNTEVAEPESLPWAPAPPSMVAVEQLTAHPGNVRDDLNLTPEFLASVAEVGVRVPLLVTCDDTDRFRIIEGHRRLSAALKAGLTEVPLSWTPAALMTRQASFWTCWWPTVAATAGTSLP
jgi:hypothetical protein